MIPKVAELVLKTIKNLKLGILVHYRVILNFCCFAKDLQSCKSLLVIPSKGADMTNNDSFTITTKWLSKQFWQKWFPKTWRLRLSSLVCLGQVWENLGNGAHTTWFWSRMVAGSPWTCGPLIIWASQIKEWKSATSDIWQPCRSQTTWLECNYENSRRLLRKITQGFLFCDQVFAGKAQCILELLESLDSHWLELGEWGLQSDVWRRFAWGLLIIRVLVLGE